MVSEQQREADDGGLAVLLKQLDDSVAIVDRHGGILMTNRSDELPAELPAVAMTGLGGYFRIFRPDGRPYDTGEWPVLRSLETGEVIVDEEFFRLEDDGSRRSFRCSSAPLHDRRGRIAGAVVVARDVSEQKHRQEQLAYLLPLLDHGEDAIIAGDAESRVIAWNHGAERMYGWSSEEAVGKSLTLMWADWNEEHHGERVRALSEHGQWRGESTARRKDGSTLPIEAITVAIRGSSGEITGYLAIHRDITERKRAEEALQEAQRRTEAVLESISDAFMAFDHEWRYTYANQRAVARVSKLWGREVSAGELLGKNCWELFPEHLGSTTDRELHRALREQEVVEFQTHSVTGAWLEVRAYPSQDGLSVYSRDISERKRAEEALREAHRRSETILASITDDFVAVDREWRYTYINDRALRSTQEWLGWPISREELLGRSLWEVFPETVGTVPYVKYHQAVRERRPVEFETYFAAKDRWFETHVYPSESGLSIYFRTITERKGAEEQLAYYARLVETMEDAVIATDDEFVVSAWNRGAQRLYGWTAKEVLGRHVRDVVRTGLSDEELDACFRGIVEDGRGRAELLVSRKDGTTVDVEIITVAIRGERGEETGYLGIHRDITERKRSEGQLAYHASLLENIDDAVLATDPDLALTAWNRGAERMFGWSAAEALGRRVNELIPTSLSDEEMAETLRELRKTGRWRGVLTWYGKGDKPVEAEGLTVATRSDDGQVSGYVCIVRDVSELSRVTARLETAAREQSLLAELSLRALGTAGVQTLLADAVAVVADVLRVDLTSIWELEPNGEQLRRRAAFGWRHEAVEGVPAIPSGWASFAGYTAMVGQPVVSEDLRTDGRFEFLSLFRAEAPVSAVAVVIPGARRPFGVLAGATRAQRSFEPAEVKFLEAVANVIGIAVERAEEGERLEAAREAERTRIARELHDSGLRELTEALGAASLGRSSATEARDEQRWAAMTVSLRRLGQQLRGAIYDLRLDSHEDRAFVDLLDELVAVQAELAADRHVLLTGQGRLPPGSLGRLGTELLRIVREAITNARRHGGATLIRVEAGGSTRERLRIVVTDDGRWPDRERAVAHRRGTGILGMFERAEAIGATLRIQGPATGGTTVSLELPLRARSGGGPRGNQVGN